MFKILIPYRWSTSLHRRAMLSFAGVGTLVLTMVACGGATVTTGGSFSSAVPTSSPLTATPIPAATCKTLLPSSVPATAGAGFADVPFPAQSVSTAILPHSSGVGQWSIFLFDICTPSSTIADVQSFFTAQLPSHGWAPSATLPFNGSYPDACGDPYCWSKDTAPRLIGLEKVANAGNGNITYTLRLFVPPALPQCPFGPFKGPSGPFDFWLLTSAVGVPAPPLGEYGPATGFDQNGYMQDPDDSMCVAGNAVSVANYFNAVMPLLGWKYGASPNGCLVGVTGTIWRKGVNMIAINTTSGSSVLNGFIFSYTACIA